MDETLARMTVDDLRRMARSLNIPGRSSMSKQQLVDAVEAYLHQSAPPVEPEPDPTAPRTDEHERFREFLEPSRLCDMCSQDGFPCGFPAVRNHHRCAIHGGIDISDLVVPAAGHLGFDTWPELIRHLRLADYDIDPLGADPVVTEMLWHIGNLLYDDYFRVEVEGAEHIPPAGPGVIVGNHGGAAFPYDGLMLSLAVANEGTMPRRLRVVGTEIFNMLPVVSHLYRKVGAAYASENDAQWVLDNRHLLGVFPEGVRGFQKPISEAYRLKRFGRGGFVEFAQRAGAPIVPVAILGSEEVHPALFTSRRLADLIRMIFPQQRVEEMAVWLNPIPLPVRWHIRFLDPIDPGSYGDRLTVLEITEQVQQSVQAALDDMITQRDGIF